MNIKNELLKNGIGFVKNGKLIPFSIDDQNPIQDGSIYGVNKDSIKQIYFAWKQWRKFVQWVLKRPSGIDFYSQFLIKGTENNWRDFERSEFEYYSNTQNHFCDLHVTRVDLALYDSGKIVILDPNVMPYGMVQLIESQKILGINYHTEYLKRLSMFNGVLSADKYHGGSYSIQSFCKKNDLDFMYSDEILNNEEIYRISRKPILGSIRTINPPGIRVIESQLWSALMNLNGVGKYFNFNLDTSLHRLNSAQCYLLKISKEKIEVATSMQDGNILYIPYKDFIDLHWGNIKNVYLKAIYTSGCHQVTFSDNKESSILKAIRNKLILFGNGFALLQPAIPCLVENERVRASVYFGNNGELYGAEVTRVPLEYKLAHDGEHAKISYLEI